MSVQNEDVSNTSVPKNATSVPREAGDAAAGNPSPDACSQPLFGVQEAAEYLGMSAKWVYRSYKTLPHVLIGSGSKPRIKFRRCDLDAWVRRHRIQ
jgi:hypothetical protein